jgi:hypothetical protein
LHIVRIGYTHSFGKKKEQHQHHQKPINSNQKRKEKQGESFLNLVYLSIYPIYLPRSDQIQKEKKFSPAKPPSVPKTLYWPQDSLRQAFHRNSAASQYSSAVW